MTEQTIAEVAYYVREIGRLKAERDRHADLTVSIAERLLAASEALAAAAARRNEAAFAARVEAYCEAMRTLIPMLEEKAVQRGES